MDKPYIKHLSLHRQICPSKLSSNFHPKEARNIYKAGKTAAFLYPCMDVEAAWNSMES
jgi:hypothetical protein